MVLEAYEHLLEAKEGKIIGYARVSSHDQKSDLQTQANRLSESGCDIVITDLGSGLNCRKPGLRKLLTQIWNGEVKELRLTHEDRLLRFGKELIFFWCKLRGVKVTVLHESEEVAFETELVKDVITLMTVFSARLYGKRSWKNRKRTDTKVLGGIVENRSSQ